MPVVDEDKHRAQSRAYYHGLSPAGKKQVMRRISGWVQKKPGWWSWCSLKQRCYNPNHPKFYLYGALDVRVCDRWRKSFTAFIADMGPRPSLKHSVDRYPDPDGDYEPDNCRWATPLQQRHSRRDCC